LPFYLIHNPSHYYYPIFFSLYPFQVLIQKMLIDPALIALSNETTCTATPDTTADAPPTATSVVRQILPPPDLEPSSGPTRSTSARAGEWTCDLEAFGMTTWFFSLTQLLALRPSPLTPRNQANSLQKMASEYYSRLHLKKN
jgi:hypothetical protein